MTARSAPETVLPTPRHLTWGDGVYRIPLEAAISGPPSAQMALAAAQELGLQPTDTPDRAQVAQVRIAIEADPDRPEGYTLRVGHDGVDIVGADAVGAFYAIQTLRQLVPAGAAGLPGQDVPALTISDQPQLRWRGLMIDTARHFKPLGWLKSVVDLMALHKLNVLHLHLTDDQGWRLEVPAYPKLTEIGAWRSETVVGHYRGETDLVYDGTPHSGFYTQQELRELVAYAHDRAVQIVPEIDMPGHMQAAIAAYPQLGVHGTPTEVRRTWGISETILGLHAETMDFCRDVLADVMDIFPSGFIHCGGDEVPKTDWRADPATQQQIVGLGLPDEEALQGWFTQQIATFLAQHDRRLLGWDEILEGGGLPPDVAVMGWRAVDRGVAAAEAGHEVVMAPTAHTYFDYYQVPDWDAEPLSFPADVSLESAYAFEPVPPDLTPSAKERILGGQAQLWAEYMPDTDDAEYKLFPRLCALAEAVWRSPDSPRDFDRFRPRVQQMLGRLNAAGVRYRPLD